MTKHKVAMDDFDETQQGSSYGGEEPRRGVYEAKLVSVVDHQSKEGNDGLKWNFEITVGEFSGWRGYVYTNLDASMWKTQQIVFAMTHSKKGMVIDTDNDGAAVVKKAKPVQVRVVNETYEGERRGKIKTILALVESDQDNEDEEDPFA